MRLPRRLCRVSRLAACSATVARCPLRSLLSFRLAAGISQLFQNENFLRYVFGIQPLFLVLLPKVSSACEKESIQKQYLNILNLHLDQLINASQRLDGECRLSNIEEFICNNTTQKIYNMAYRLNRLSNCIMSTDLKNFMNIVYEHTISLLETCIKEEERRQRTETCKKSNSTVSCRIKKTISKLQLCWTQYMTS